MDWQSITGASSVVIALCALAISIWQGAQARKHNRLSFRPHLATWTHKNAETGSYEVELMNNGLGPAMIKKFALFVDGKLISGDGTEPIEKTLKILFPNIPYQSQQSYLSNGYSMAPKERCSIIKLRFTTPQLLTLELVEHASRRCDLEICYTSFYGEVFHLSTQKERQSKPS